MKVIRIVSELDFGGVEKVMAYTLPPISLIETIDIKVLVLGKGGRVSDELLSAGILVEIWNENPKIPNLKLLWKLVTYLKKERPQVIHCQGGEANFHGILAGFMAQIPNRIGEEIGMPNHHSYWRFIFKFVYFFAKKVIVVAQNVRDKILELKEVSPKKIEVLYNPIKLPERNNLKFFNLHQFNSIDSDSAIKEKQHDPFIFITTCRLVKIKNLERLLEAFNQLKLMHSYKEIELWIVGDGPEKESLKKITKDLFLTGDVKFWGFQEDIFELLKKAKVFILPSLSEGSPVSLTESMIVGLPSIVTQVGGGAEILGNSNSGILINPVDLPDIIKAMNQLFIMPEKERIAMGERAKKEATRFTMELYLPNLLQIYKSVN